MQGCSARTVHRARSKESKEGWCGGGSAWFVQRCTCVRVCMRGCGLLVAGRRVGWKIGRMGAPCGQGCAGLCFPCDMSSYLPQRAVVCTVYGLFFLTFVCMYVQVWKTNVDMA